MPIQFEEPVGKGGEPVVVVAVEHDLGLVGDPRAREQRLPLLLCRDVAHWTPLEVCLPAPANRAGDMPSIVCAGVHVHLDQPHPRIVQMLRRPLRLDQRLWMGIPIPRHVLRHFVASSGNPASTFSIYTRA
jgi:hypothetical protein